ncbi:WSC domain-containing protein [Mycena epipterygia]|nr:WSC domain-containing protein [Mycena epipterygia]
MFLRAAFIILALNNLALHIYVAAETPSTLPTYKTWSSIGCQRDSVDGRVLKHLVTLTNTTVEACLDACAVDNYALGGLEFGHECFCGNAILYDYLEAPSCTLPCVGNASELCGGPESLSIYQNANMPFTIGNGSVVENYGLWSLWACVEENENENGGLLPHGPKVPIPTEEMTVERCADGCTAAFFTTAGLERGQECHCGNITTPWPSGWESTSFSECNLPCLGNATELCGGTLDGGRFFAYSNLPEVASAPPEWLEQGCWIDDVASNGGKHLLPHAPNVTIPSAEMTVEKCISACNTTAGGAGYNISAGLVNGDECWCGDYSTTPGVPAQNACDARCTGNGREVCGGTNLMFIYGTPVIALQSYSIFFGTWTLQGCFIDNEASPLLPNRPTLLPDFMTARHCLDSCWSLNFSSAGVEQGNECWCGNITDTSIVQAPISDCNARCSDDPFESCGGDNRLQMYHFSGTFE